jgi:type VI secretion system protein ImpK
MKTAIDVVRLALPDVCADLFLFAFNLQKALAEEADAEKVQGMVDAIFQRLEAGAQQAEIPLDDLQHAKYALAAFVDELVLNSNLPFTMGWSSRPLQLKYFDDSAAGEEFYNRIDNLRHSADGRVATALEMYYTCLVLGFRGKYTDSTGQERRRVLAFKLAQDIRAALPWKAEGLIPGPETPGDQPRTERPLPYWIVPTACAALILLAFLAFNFLLDRSVADLVASLG